MFGYIYKCTYLKNNKIYIGASKNLNAINTYLGSSRHWIKEVDPYHNKDQIKKEILEYIDSQEQLYEREEYWISFYNSTNPKIGYNLAKGGRHAFVVSEESKKIRDQHDSETMKKKMEDPELRKRISEGLKKYKAEHGVSEEHRKHLSEALKGRNIGCSGDTRSIGVGCVFNDKVYEFHNKRQAAKWWYDNYPFSSNYSESTYTRAMKANMNNEDYKYKKQTIDMSKILWYYLDDKYLQNNPVYCMFNEKTYQFKNKYIAILWWHINYPLSKEKFNKHRYLQRLNRSIKGQNIYYHGWIFKKIKWMEGDIHDQN